VTFRSLPSMGVGLRALQTRRFASESSPWGNVEKGRTSLWGKPETLVHPDIALDDESVVYQDDANNVPRSAGQRVLHLDLGPGEVANRILSVGDPQRAKRIAAHLDDPTKTFFHVSMRGFAAYTGRLEGVPVTIMSMGMGFPMMDFAVRECRAIVEGPMAIARFGTCGSLRASVPCGTVVVTGEEQGSVMVLRHPDAYGEGGAGRCFTVSRPILPTAQLTEFLYQELQEALGADAVAKGLNASSDSFYASQGRIDPRFDDKNHKLIEELLQAQPGALSCEMETFHLLDLARCSHETIFAGAASIACGNRITNDVLTTAELAVLERDGGLAMLKALIRWKPRLRPLT